ncbi:hypothetical protein BU24DRAFT_272006 [Aaosphaeria arxii CBS 175.79]|uniref:Uncharacterized protein n=1 Tax=Aaosphaeria arxii CBS 175.79 TaxID=1450172 RepID=A0A6A5XG99_9PLEO|nr:uncharacterized protein BU24DRAFT_272006 [Aaosphaeria arxii CBS 175.79]KAF2012198.1 hypothetical protein BU24DRAFT_272006 [Aaosphaeria arxii CBS 175.79]
MHFHTRQGSSDTRTPKTSVSHSHIHTLPLRSTLLLDFTFIGDITWTGSMYMNSIFLNVYNTLYFVVYKGKDMKRGNRLNTLRLRDNGKKKALERDETVSSENINYQLPEVLQITAIPMR